MGVWNIRAQNLDTWFLGQEVYVRVVNPEITNKTELAIPDNALYCGALSHLQKYVAKSLLTLKCLFSFLFCFFSNEWVKHFLNFQAAETPLKVFSITYRGAKSAAVDSDVAFCCNFHFPLMFAVFKTSLMECFPLCGSLFAQRFRLQGLGVWTLSC